SRRVSRAWTATSGSQRLIDAGPYTLTACPRTRRGLGLVGGRRVRAAGPGPLGRRGWGRTVRTLAPAAPGATGPRATTAAGARAARVPRRRGRGGRGRCRLLVARRCRRCRRRRRRGQVDATGHDEQLAARPGRRGGEGDRLAALLPGPHEL